MSTLNRWRRVRLVLPIFVVFLQPFAGHGSPSPGQERKMVVEFRKDGSGVDFSVIGWPSALKINGKGPAPQGSLSLVGRQVTGVLNLQMDTLQTGISLRDHHMKERYLEVARFPISQLSITSVNLPPTANPESFAGTDIPFEGKLLLHGVERPLRGKANVSSLNNQVRVNANFDLKFQDYSIETPSFAGIILAQDIKVSVKLSGQVRWVAQQN